MSLLGLCVGLAPVAQAQVVGRWFNGTGGTQVWNSGPNWSPATVPNASGDIANIVANITANQIIDLSGSITIGTLNLGDFSSNQTYTIGVLGDTLNFDNRFWGSADLGAAAQLNKVMGGADVIAANVELVSDLIIYNRVALTISGQINDSALGKSLRKMGTSDLTLSGINGYTGDTIISTTGGTVFLNATGGNAINSQLIRLGNSSLDGGSTVRLRLLQSNQINDTAVIRFDGAAGREAFFQLNGQSETIQGISDYTGRGVIENIGGAASTLTINTAGLSQGCYMFTLRGHGTNSDGQPVNHLASVRFTVAATTSSGQYVDIIGFAVFEIDSIGANNINGHAVSPIYADPHDPGLRRAQRARLQPWS